MPDSSSKVSSVAAEKGVDCMMVVDKSYAPSGRNPISISGAAATHHRSGKNGNRKGPQKLDIKRCETSPVRILARRRWEMSPPSGIYLHCPRLATNKEALAQNLFYQRDVHMKLKAWNAGAIAILDRYDHIIRFTLS